MKDHRDTFQIVRDVLVTTSKEEANIQSIITFANLNHTTSKYFVEKLIRLGYIRIISRNHKSGNTKQYYAITKKGLKLVCSISDWCNDEN